MKKLFLFKAFLVTLGAVSHAQTNGKTTKDYSTKTITTADTITFNGVGSKVVSYQATFKKSSGTAAGKFYLEGSNDGLFWQNIDSSKSLVDNTNYQGIIVTVTTTSYDRVRVRCSNTSSATGVLYFTILHKFDDR